MKNGISKERGSKRIAYCNQVLKAIEGLDFVRQSFRYIDARTNCYRVKFADYTHGFNDERFNACKKTLEEIFAKHSFVGVKIRRSQKNWTNEGYKDDTLCITVPFAEGWEE